MRRFLPAHPSVSHASRRGHTRFGLRRGQQRVVCSAVVVASVAFTGAAVPPLASAAAGSPALASPTVSVDESVPPVSEPTEVLLEERATESSNTWLRPDGLLRTEVFPAPVNYETADGGFAPINNELVDSAATGVAVENAANDYTARLPQDAGSKAVKVTAEGRWVSFQMQGLDGAPVVEGTEATYTDVADAAEVVYEAASTGLKESVVLDAAPTGPVAYVFDLAVSAGLTPQLTAANSVEVLDGQGAVVFSVPAPFMVDSADPEPAFSTNVVFDLAAGGTGWVLTMTPAHDWLVDPARVFPVVVDPTITDGEVVRDCTLNKAQPDTSFCGDSSNRIKVGSTGGTARRGALKFNLEELPANDITVTEALMKLYLDSDASTAAAGGGQGPEYVARRLTEGWTSTATWNSRWTGQSWATAGGTFVGSASGLPIVGNNEGYKSIPATAVVNSWLSGQPNQGLIVKQATPEDTASLLWFYSSAASNTDRWPKLEVTYTDSSGVGASGAGDRSYFTYVSEKLTDRMQAKANVGSGNLLLGVSDLNIAGVAGLDFNLTRTYNSVLDNGSTTGGDLSGMGPGWSHNLGGSVRLEFPSGTNRVLFHGPSGYRVRFEKNISGNYFAVAPGLAGSSLKTVTGGYELTFRDKQVYKFTSTGRLSEIRDKQGNKLQMSYVTSGSDSGKLDYVTDTRERKIDFVYDALSGMLTSVEVRSPSNTLLVTHTYTYDGSPLRLSSSAITQVASTLVATGGDSVNVATNGSIKTTYEYANGRLATVKDARENAPNSDHDGGTTTFGYHTSGGDAGKIQTITRVTDDDQDRVIPDSVTTITYQSSLPSDCNSQGTTATFVDGERESPVDDTTTYCVDEKFRVERTVDAKDHVRKQTWTSQSNVETFDASGLSAGGNTFTYDYDDSDNPTQVQTPTGGTAGATYTDTVNPTFPTSMSDFDTGGSSGSPTWVYDYDDKGNLIQAKADLDTGTGDDIEYRYCWDGDGQLTRVDPIGTAGGMSSGNLDTNTSGDGCTPSGQANDTLYAYNTSKELQSINAPGANRDVSYTYDALSRIKTITDGRGVVTTFTYDALDHLVAQEFSDNNTDSVARVGNSTTRVDWLYDENGNRTSVDTTNDGRSATTFVYDELNRVISQSQTSPANAMEFFYDPADNLTKFDDEHDPTLYTYDAVNLATSIDDPRPNATGVTAETQFAYDRHDKRVKTTFHIAGGNPLVERAKYNDAGQPICIYSYRLNTSPLSSQDETLEEPPCPSAEATGLITFFRYDYTAPGGFKTSNKYTTTTKGKVTWNYSYDPISRLEKATHREGWDTTGTGTPMRKYEYSYDRHSNLTQEKRSGSSYNSVTSYLDMAYNTADELCWSRDNSTAATGTGCTDTPTGRFTYTYDGAGALATVTDTTSAVTPMTLGYNVIGQTAQADPFGSATAFDMAYVGVTQDRRVEKDGLRMAYGFSGLSSQAPNSGTVHAEYFVRDPGGRLVAMVDLVHDNPDRYYLMDDQQSVVATVETDTGVVRRYLYEPYGEETRASWTDPNPGSNNNGTIGGVNAKPADGSEELAPENDPDYNPWRFASGYYDPETRMLKYGTRYYMPNLARWTQIDPQAGSPQQPLTLNPYLYVNSDPLNAVDPSGRSCFDVSVVVVSFGDCDGDGYFNLGYSGVGVAFTGSTLGYDEAPDDGFSASCTAIFPVGATVSYEDGELDADGGFGLSLGCGFGYPVSGLLP